MGLSTRVKRSETPVVKPNQVTGLNVIEKTDTTLNLGWNAATVGAGGGEVLGYAIFQNGVRVLDVGPRTSQMIEGLLAGSTSNWRVLAFNAAGDGPWSSFLAVTQSVTAPPTPPTNFRFLSRGASTASVAWDASEVPEDDPVLTYKVRKTGLPGILADVNGTTLTANLTGLAANDNLNVRSDNLAGASTRSNEITFQPNNVNENGMVAVAAGKITATYSVATLLQNSNSLYGDVPATKAALIDLGVKQIRARFQPNIASSVNAIRDLADAGIRYCARFGAAEHSFSSQDTPAELVQKLIDHFGANTQNPNRDIKKYIYAIEGLNEPNNNGTAWITRTRQYTKDTWDAVQAEDQLSDWVPLMGPALARIQGTSGAEGGAWNANTQTYANGTLGGQAANFAAECEKIHNQDGKGLNPWTNMGVMHIYPLGSTPSTDYMTFYTPTRRLYPSPRIMAVTEGGYFTDMAYGGGSNPTPEHVAALYHDKHITEHFLRGSRWFNQHELWDDAIRQPPYSSTNPEPDDKTRRESSFGLKRANKNPKPGWWTVRRFLALLNDDDANGNPKEDYAAQQLGITISPTPTDWGTSQELRAILTQKSNGIWYLILWRDRNVNWSRTAPYNITAAPVMNVDLTLVSAKTMTVYAPSKNPGATTNKEGDPVIAATTGTTLRIPIQDNLHVVKIAPT